ncbi:MAG: hypothetical protein PHP53_20810 [Prolixibacteraceae bacterium]|nr:hypothetical protein [Prolixibacteraceae bacterium]
MYPPFKIKELASDSLMTEINDKFKKYIQKDFDVEETYMVLIDLLKLNAGVK